MFPTPFGFFRIRCKCMGNIPRTNIFCPAGLIHSPGCCPGLTSFAHTGRLGCMFLIPRALTRADIGCLFGAFLLKLLYMLLVYCDLYHSLPPRYHPHDLSGCVGENRSGDNGGDAMHIRHIARRNEHQHRAAIRLRFIPMLLIFLIVLNI